MGVIDKNGVLGRLAVRKPLVLELGCGSSKRRREAIGIDILDSPAVDIVGEAREVLALFPAAVVDVVYSEHFVEHVADLPELLAEVARVVKPGGLVEMVAPHFSNPYFYSDPTHRHFFGLYTMCYYAQCSPFARTVPTYGHSLEFELVSVDLGFKAERPFVVRYGIKRVVGWLFNSCNYLKEFYEENLCYLFPCYEIRYRLRRLPASEAPRA